MRLLGLFCLLATLSVGAAQVREYRYTNLHQLAAMVVHKEKPEYPFEARWAHQEGEGCVRLYVARDGTVTGVKIVESTGHELLDASCLKAFRNWKWKPGLRREIDLPVSFEIHGVGTYRPPVVKQKTAIVREFQD
jgi:TonB family protein